MADFEVKVYPLRIAEHPNADLLELGLIGDYQSCIVKDKYQEGQLIAYIPEGAVVPDSIIQELGLEGKLAGSKHNRVKAIRLRGVLSQGLVYPVQDAEEGDDVTERLGIVKYEPPIPESMGGDVRNSFGKTLKFDIENVKKYPHILQDGEMVVISEKLHGTFCGIGYQEGEWIVGSKGLYEQGLSFKVDEGLNEKNVYVRMWRKLRPQFESLFASMGNGDGFVLGEIYGPGIQDLHYGESAKHFRVFDIYAGSRSKGHYLWPVDVEHQAHLHGLDTVPQLYTGEYSRAVLDEYTNGKTTLAGAHVREGVVVRSALNRRDLEIGRVILKSVSEKYLLRKGGTEYN